MRTSSNRSYRRNSALRVAFLTCPAFQALIPRAQQAQKKQALRVIMRQVRYPVVENSNYPDILFYILRLPGSKRFMLRKVKT